MLVGEVVVTPLFEAGIVGFIVLVAGFFDRLVEVDSVFIEEVAWCEVCSATKPPRIRRPIIILGLEVSVIEMNGRGHRIHRMENHTQASCKELKRLDIGADRFVIYSHLLNGCSGKSAINDADVDSSFLEHISIL